MDKKRCPSCGIVYPVSGFALDRSHKDGLQSRCRRCNKERRKAYKAYDKAYAQEHREERLQHSYNWRKRNPEKRAVENRMAQHNRRNRMRENGKLSATDLNDIVRRQRGRCAYCGKRRKVMEFDHIVAVSRSGRNEKKNIQLLCRACNRRKHDKDPIEFAQQIGLLL